MPCRQDYVHTNWWHKVMYGELPRSLLYRLPRSHQCSGFGGSKVINCPSMSQSISSDWGKPPGQSYFFKFMWAMIWMRKQIGQSNLALSWDGHIQFPWLTVSLRWGSERSLYDWLGRWTQEPTCHQIRLIIPVRTLAWSSSSLGSLINF